MAELMSGYLPQSYGKAYRWIAEMEEIADDFSGVPGGTGSFRAAAELFSAVAQANNERGCDGNLIDAVEHFLAGL